MNRIHSISVPYAVMKACPLSWVQRVHVHKGTLQYSQEIVSHRYNPNAPYGHAARVALVKCRDLHWAMMARREQRDTSLASLRMLIVADGANPCECLIEASFARLGLVFNVLSPRVGVVL